MNRESEKWVVRFLEKNYAYFEDDNFDELYNKINSDPNTIQSYMTQYFLENGINPLDYVEDSVPYQYAYGLEYTGGLHITIPQHIENIGAYAFHSCYDLDHVNLSNIRVINENSFANSTIGGDLVLPNVIFLGTDSFADTDVTSVKLDKVERMHGQVFYNCKNLKEVWLPDTIKYVGQDVFRRCHPDFILHCSHKVDEEMQFNNGGATFNDYLKGRVRYTD